MAPKSKHPQVKAHTASAQDVAEHFGVHPATVYNWLKSPSPPPHRRVGSQYRFNLEEVDEWAARGGREGAA